MAVEYESDAQDEDVKYYESYGNNFIGAFLSRLASDVQALNGFGASILPKIISSFNVQDWINKIKGVQSNQLEEISYYNRYGLR